MDLPPSSQPGASDSAGNLTRLFDQISVGQRPLSDAFMAVYDELRAMAAARMAREKPGHTLQATALVHELWIKLNAAGQPFHSRDQFFYSAAQAMRRLLVDSARRRNAKARGGGSTRQDLAPDLIECNRPPDEILTVDEVLDNLARTDDRKAAIIQLWYFLDLPRDTIADILKVDIRTVDREIKFVRAYVSSQLQS